ncbi:pyridoxamine 5'-phosphate oxidase family protein [Streptomyces scabiei]|uniref:pyridoxamine 5'-phosphate oxidase family protein n=1 Tax=Streptomyces scabiei TaxID=1930 RepID=UPI003690C653
MSTPPVSPCMAEVSGAEARSLLQGSSPGRPVHAQRDPTVVRPGRHTWEFGRLVVCTPALTAAIPTTATYRGDETGGVAGTGWTTTGAGPAEVMTDPGEAALPHGLEGMGGAPIRRAPSGRAHGPHDTLPRLRALLTDLRRKGPSPKAMTGFRLARAEA